MKFIKAKILLMTTGLVLAPGTEKKIKKVFILLVSLFKVLRLIQFLIRESLNATPVLPPLLPQK